MGGTPPSFFVPFVCSACRSSLQFFPSHHDTDNRRLPPCGLSREVRDARKRRSEQQAGSAPATVRRREKRENECENVRERRQFLPTALPPDLFSADSKTVSPSTHAPF